ncbi:MAG: DUF1343 domain-containing protein [Acidobacteria bacterium]|nr:DUF1343 domain-containing protein [Acidobacteriota bacterium]
MQTRVKTRAKASNTLLNSVCLFFFVSIYLCSLSTGLFAQVLSPASPQTVGMNPDKLAEIGPIVNQAIADKELPGAVVLIGHRGRIVYRQAFGNRAIVPNVEKMTVDTIFDLASLTKVVATTTSIMKLVEDGKLRLNDSVGKYFPEIKDERAKTITILELLTHTSGYAPDFDLKQKWSGQDGMLQALYKEKLRDLPGTQFVYSDINFEILGALVLKVSGKPLDDFAYENVFRKVGMDRTFFIKLLLPTSDTGDVVSAVDLPSAIDQRIAPTENIRGQQSYLGSKFDGDSKTGDRILRGAVHDPTAYRMGGVAGHAGLFSTADDLAIFCQMLLNGGTYNGRRVLSRATVNRMTTPLVVSEGGDTRGLGWDIDTPFSSNRGELFPRGSFGHTGFTGTSLWIDRVSQTFVVFLSNRVHPTGKGNVTPLRAKIATLAAAAVEDTPIEKIREAEAEYQAQVAAKLPIFKQKAEWIKDFSRLEFGGLVSPMNRIDKLVLNGIDVLERDGFKQLEGLKIGLVTNQTGRDLNGDLTIDVLHKAANVNLTALFSPEHGIRGELDQEKIGDTKDEKTGLPIYSLYGETRRPTPEQLKSLDAIVYDIQDVGTRFYTYTATLRNVMEEAAKAGKPVFVLDRPNPLNGFGVEGPLADEEKLSFIAAHTMPVRYGMTIGEFAKMMNAERKIGANLRVIEMSGWKRSMWFDQTGQTWVNPSPNMRSLTEATLYPGIGLLETTNVSVGRGTDTPFEVVGAPWIDGRKLATELNGMGLKGVRFVPIKFAPTASVFKGEACGGVNVIIIDRGVFNSVRTGLAIAIALRKLYPTDWQIDRFGRLLVNAETLDDLKQGTSLEKLERSTAPALSEFLRRRGAYLLYK